MRRSLIKINLKDRVEKCDELITAHLVKYTSEAEAGGLNKYAANKNILIILEYKELAQLLQTKGLSWDDVVQMVEDIKIRKIARQSKMNF